MLSQHDSRTLAEIEEHLRTSDPDLVRQFDQRNASAPRRRRLPRILGLAGLLLGALLGVTALAAHNADAAVLTTAVLLMDAVWWAALLLAALIRSWEAARRSGDRDDWP